MRGEAQPAAATLALLDALERATPVDQAAQLPLLTGLLDAPQGWIRRRAIAYLARLGAGAWPALPALEELLIIDDDAHLEVLRALARIDLARCLSALAVDLASPDTSVRVLATTVLAELGRLGLPLQPALINALDERDARVFLGAAFALSTHGAAGAAAIEPMRALRDKHVYPPYRMVLDAALDDAQRAWSTAQFASQRDVPATPARQALYELVAQAPEANNEPALAAWIDAIERIDHQAAVRAAIACAWSTIQIWERDYRDDRSPRTALNAAMQWVCCPCDALQESANGAAQRLPSQGCSEGAFQAAWACIHAAGVAQAGAAVQAALRACKALCDADALTVVSAPTAVALLIAQVQGELLPWCQGLWDPNCPSR